MHLACISIPLFCLTWFFVQTVFNIVLAFTILRMDEVYITTRLYQAFSIISVIVYACVASPLFVYSYKYGTSVSNRSARLLSGLSVMFVFSSFPMTIIMVVILINEYDTVYYSFFIFLVALHAISFAFGLFVSWFAFLRLIAARFHRWRGPERQILPFQGDEYNEICRAGYRENLGVSFFHGDEQTDLI